MQCRRQQLNEFIGFRIRKKFLWMWSGVRVYDELREPYVWLKKETV